MIITKTPFRMSFFGGGTDMESFFRENGGAVLFIIHQRLMNQTCKEVEAMKELRKKLKEHVELLIARYPMLEGCEDSIIRAYFLLEESYSKGNKLLVAGNGGSAADSEHIVGELMKGFKLPRKLDENNAIAEVRKYIDDLSAIVNQYI